YEVVPGATDAVARESIEDLFQVFRDRPKRSAYRSLVWHLTTGYFTRALREVHRKFSTIEVDRLRVKPTVKITGEFYLQTVDAEPVRIAETGRAVLPQSTRRRRGRHARGQGAVGASQEEGPHDLRALAVLLHAQHDVDRRHGRCRREVPGPALRAARDQGRCRGPRALALPDDPHRGQEARAARIRRGAAEHRPDRRRGARLRGRASRDEEGDVSRAARRPR